MTRIPAPAVVPPVSSRSWWLEQALRADSEPVRRLLVRSISWTYEVGDRAHEQGRRPRLASRAVIAGYGAYAALGRATRGNPKS